MAPSTTWPTCRSSRHSRGAGSWDEVSAARAAALGFELLTALALFGLGRRHPSGTRGRDARHRPRLRLARLPVHPLHARLELQRRPGGVPGGLLPAGALLAPARGALSALAGLTKFGPLILAPLFAAGHGERRARPMILFTVAFLAAAAVVTIPLLPDGGFRELYDRSLGYQASRGSPFSVWGQAPSLHFLQTLSKVFAVGLAALFFFVPETALDRPGRGPRRGAPDRRPGDRQPLVLSLRRLVRPARARGGVRPPARPRSCPPGPAEPTIPPVRGGTSGLPVCCGLTGELTGYG